MLKVSPGGAFFVSHPLFPRGYMSSFSRECFHIVSFSSFLFNGSTRIEQKCAEYACFCCNHPLVLGVFSTTPSYLYFFVGLPSPVSDISTTLGTHYSLLRPPPLLYSLTIVTIVVGEDSVLFMAALYSRFVLWHLLDVYTNMCR